MRCDCVESTLSIADASSSAVVGEVRLKGRVLGRQRVDGMVLVDDRLVLMGSPDSGLVGGCLQRLLLTTVGKADLNESCLAVLSDGTVVISSNDSFTSLSAIETSETNSSGHTVRVAKDTARADFEWFKDVGKLMFVHALREARDVEVGRVGVAELLELGIEGLPGKGGLIAQGVKGTDTVFRILVVVVFDKAISSDCVSCD